jgi:hypothetical protein
MVCPRLVYDVIVLTTDAWTAVSLRSGLHQRGDETSGDMFINQKNSV